MTEFREIIHRLRRGQSHRLIHKELGIYRPLISELHSLAIAHQWLDSAQVMPSDEEISKAWKPKEERAQTHILDLFHDEIKQWVDEGCSSVVIQQLLKDKCPCDVQAIRRYRNKHFPKPIDPVMVRQTIPGKDLDIDFGYLGKFLYDGVLRKAWLFSLRLRHSRKAYREVVLDQKASTFLMGHVHAFEWFNGVPQNLVHDNLKAAIVKSTIDNDMIRRSYQELAEYYGCIITPCLPRTPEHKGGVEGDMKYVKKNFLPYFRARQKEKNIAQSTLEDLIEALDKWGAEVADLHIVHGVGRSPLEIFKSEEEKALQPLPKNRWELTSWSECSVRKDWRIMHGSAYYSVPFQLIGKTVQVCTTASFVRIFHDFQEVALHPRAKTKWEYQRKTEHAPPFQEAVLACSREGLLQLAEDIGSYTYQVVHTILSHPSIDKLRPVRHLLGLVKKYSQERLEKACQRAFHCKMFSYRNVKNILENGLESDPIEPSTDKVVSFPPFRFVRDPEDYKHVQDEHREETFTEKLERLHPVSKHGNAMLGVVLALSADELIEEEMRRKQEEGSP